MTEHPDALLSAFLDLALDGPERDRVAAHLVGCGICRTHLAELAATARLIGALPPPAPSRSLVPRLGRAPVWLRPVRALGAVSTGAFLFLFLASAVLNSGSGLGGGTTAAERAAEQGKFGVAASLAAQPAVAPAPAAAAPSLSRNDAAASPSAPAQLGTAASARPTGPTGLATSAAPERPQFGPPPGAFLGLALASALVVFLAHRRLRRT